MRDVFISFASKETDEATRVCHHIEENGYTCFISTRDLVPGEEYAAQLIENIGNSKTVVLLLSEASNVSPHVLREVEYAVSKRIPILVYTLEKVTLTKSMEYYLMTHQWITGDHDRDHVLLLGIKHIVEGGVSLTTENIQPMSENHSPKTAGTTALEEHSNAVATKSLSSQQNSSRFFGILAIIAVLLIGCLFLIPKLFSVNEAIPDSPNYSLGDTITFGQYYDDPIEWRVIQMEGNTVTLLSKYLLSFKAYDAAEGGEYNSYAGVDYWSSQNRIIDDPETLRLVRGNNDWSICNLRTWLNSSAEVVHYEDQAPTLSAVGKNFYSSEPGFLHDFTEAEKAAMVEVTHSATANVFSSGAVNGQVTTTDLVYLLSSQELSLLDEAGISIYAEPTESCKQHDYEPGNYRYYAEELHVNSYYWWLRDNPGEKLNETYIVVTEYEDGYQYIPSAVGIPAYGVRPVICVDLTKLPTQEVTP